MSRILFTGLAALGLLMQTGANAAVTVANSGFETPAAPGYAVYNNGSDIDGWSVFGSVLTIQNGYTEACDSGCGNLNFGSFEGLQHLDITGAGNTGASGVFQDISTIAGKLYSLTFYLGNIHGAAPGDSRYSVASSILVDVGNTSVVKTNAFSSGNDVNWAVQKVYFTAGPGSTTQLRFTNATAGDNFAGLDAVSVEAVPEPATMALFGAGLAGLALLRRKRAA